MTRLYRDDHADLWIGAPSPADAERIRAALGRPTVYDEARGTWVRPLTEAPPVRALREVSRG